MPPGELFILSAPSGAGKTTLVRRLLAEAGERLAPLAFSVSHTTRRPRAGEVDGHDYHFVTLEEFHRMTAEERFLEHEEVHGNYYGTSRDEVLPRLAAGTDVVLDIDVKGAQTVLRRFPEAIGIFVMPPSFGALRERLQARGLDDPAEISRRLAVSLWEIRQFRSYRYVIINDDAHRAGDALAAIVLARRQLSRRLEARLEEVLASFEADFQSGPARARTE